MEKRIKNYVFDPSKPIGQGSFSKVFFGRDEITNAEVAVKVIDINNISDQLKSMLESEINIMKKLNHPNIVKIFDVLLTINNAYVIIEYCNQGDLDNQLKNKKIFSEEEALNILNDILNGFSEMIKYGILHRDIKPANIFIHNNVCKIGDFGFAKTVDNLNQTLLKSVVGTPLYMSPQILQNSNYSAKNDIWAVGILYYEMLFGQTPWQCHSTQELLYKMHKNKLVFPPHAKVSEQSKDFLISCLQINEKLRFTWEQLFQHPLIKNIRQRSEMPEDIKNNIQKNKDSGFQEQKYSNSSKSTTDQSKTHENYNNDQDIYFDDQKVIRNQSNENLVFQKRQQQDKFIFSNNKSDVDTNVNNSNQEIKIKKFHNNYNSQKEIQSIKNYDSNNHTINQQYHDDQQYKYSNNKIFDQYVQKLEQPQENIHQMKVYPIQNSQKRRGSPEIFARTQSPKPFNQNDEHNQLLYGNLEQINRNESSHYFQDFILKNEKIIQQQISLHDLFMKIFNQISMVRHQIQIQPYLLEKIQFLSVKASQEILRKLIQMSQNHNSFNLYEFDKFMQSDSFTNYLQIAQQSYFHCNSKIFPQIFNEIYYSNPLYLQDITSEQEFGRLFNQSNVQNFHEFLIFFLQKLQQAIRALNHAIMIKMKQVIDSQAVKLLQIFFKCQRILKRLQLLNFQYDVFSMETDQQQFNVNEQCDLEGYLNIRQQIHDNKL